MSWTLQDAKNRFSAVVEAALTHEPQLVTRRGAPAVVVLAVEDYERLCGAARPRFIDHLLAIPQVGADEEVDPRAEARPRDVAF